MSAKRIEAEIRNLDNALSENLILNYLISDDKKQITVSFTGPSNTVYENCNYCVKFVFSKDYPFKQAEGFFIGESPNHPFYDFDKDDEMRVKRTTNLANTDYGIFHGTYRPSLTILDYVKRIQYSLTDEGKCEMQIFMQAYT